MEKIKIKNISILCASHKGFDDRGCIGCNCDDSCCKFGADFDEEAYQFVIQHKDKIEKLIGVKIEDCFEKEIHKYSDYLGGQMRRSKMKGRYCVFHKLNKKGCTLYQLVHEEKISPRILPTICKTFPLSWENDKILLYNEQADSVIPIDCNCLEIANTSTKSILETQKDIIDDVFEIENNLRN